MEMYYCVRVSVYIKKIGISPHTAYLIVDTLPSIIRSKILACFR